MAKGAHLGVGWLRQRFNGGGLFELRHGDCDSTAVGHHRGEGLGVVLVALEVH